MARACSDNVAGYRVLYVDPDEPTEVRSLTRGRQLPDGARAIVLPYLELESDGDASAADWWQAIGDMDWYAGTVHVEQFQRAVETLEGPHPGTFAVIEHRGGDVVLLHDEMWGSFSPVESEIYRREPLEKLCEQMRRRNATGGSAAVARERLLEHAAELCELTGTTPDGPVDWSAGRRTGEVSQELGLNVHGDKVDDTVEAFRALLENPGSDGMLTDLEQHHAGLFGEVEGLARRLQLSSRWQVPLGYLYRPQLLERVEATPCTDEELARRADTALDPRRSWTVSLMCTRQESDHPSEGDIQAVTWVSAAPVVADGDSTTALDRLVVDAHCRDELVSPTVNAYLTGWEDHLVTQRTAVHEFPLPGGTDTLEGGCVYIAWVPNVDARGYHNFAKSPADARPIGAYPTRAQAVEAAEQAAGTIPESGSWVLHGPALWTDDPGDEDSASALGRSAITAVPVTELGGAGVDEVDDGAIHDLVGRVQAELDAISSSRNGARSGYASEVSRARRDGGLTDLFDADGAPLYGPPVDAEEADARSARCAEARWLRDLGDDTDIMGATAFG